MAVCGWPLKSLLNRWAEWFAARLRSSIVVRTTLAILALSMILGLTFAVFVSASVDRREQQRAQIRLEQLLSTVERTAQIACYLKDRTLAAEIAQGLIRNRAVSGVRIAAGNDILSQIGDTVAAHRLATSSSLVAMRINSPFEDHEPVGDVSLFVDYAAIHAEASSYSRAASVAMALQAALVAAGVAVAVYIFTTRPIGSVSKELHRIRFDTAARLRAPAGNRFDEIGSLVTDVNALIASRDDLLTTERDLRIAHEVGERKMRLIFEKAETGIFMLNEAGTLESWNPALVRLLHLTPEQLPQLGVTQLQQLLAPHAARVNELIQRCLTTGESNDLDLEIATDGNSRAAWIEIALNPIGPTALQGIVNDITERKQGELSAQVQATQDVVTGLLNRRGLEMGLAAAFSLRSSESAPELAVLQIDLDFFKEVNDTHGHEGGDQVLRQVGAILQHNSRRGDLIARPGGDEFVVALVGIADPLKAEQIANAIIHEIQRPIDIGGHCVRIGASIGVAFATGVGDSPEALMRRADAAMYSAKRSGRGQACLAPETARPRASAVA
jgi:diguanylate cyclase (GGDEF)-like protein/PAS domain S-box-containing protein